MTAKPASPGIVALGANLPFSEQSPANVMGLAMQAMEREGLRIVKKSCIWSTPCFPAGAGPDYVNAVVVVEDELCGPFTSWLQRLHRIEAEFGRERLSRWSGRTLDLDLIAVGESVLPDVATHDRWRELPLETQMRVAPEELILPHPRLQDRAFVLVPMAEVAPDWRHPRLGLTTVEMLAALPEEDRSAVRRLE